MLKRNSPIYLITVSMLIVGIVLVILIRSYSNASVETARQDNAFPSILQFELENEQMAKVNEKLWEELTKLKAGQSATALASQQLEEAKMNSGVVSVSGPGIKIILDDSDLTERKSDFANYVIHEEYLRQLINILWNGGAEAIAVNNQRITTHSEIFCSGSYIQINGTRQMPPYTITAIGNKENLQSSLQFYFWDRLGDYQEQYGITRKLEIPEEDVVVPGINAYSYKYAEPVKEG